MNLQILEKVPNSVGYLMMNEVGATIASEGELENDERTADIIFNLVSLTDRLDKNAFPQDGFNKMSVTFQNFSYVICLSNKRIHVVKVKMQPNRMEPPVEPSNIDHQVPVTNSINS